VLLSLQRLIDQAYAAGGYGDDLDYSQKPMPPLRGDDAAWAKTLLEQHTKPTGERGASAP
jgi:hypothetical protein